MGGVMVTEGLVNVLHIIGDADAAMATEDGEGGWKTVEALPWEDSDRDYTYEEVSNLFHHCVSNYCTPLVTGESF